MRRYSFIFLGVLAAACAWAMPSRADSIPPNLDDSNANNGTVTSPYTGAGNDGSFTSAPATSGAGSPSLFHVPTYLPPTHWLDGAEHTFDPPPSDPAVNGDAQTIPLPPAVWAGMSMLATMAMGSAWRRRRHTKHS